MLVIMADAIETSPATTPSAVQATAEALAAVVQQGDELSAAAQVSWSYFKICLVVS